MILMKDIRKSQWVSDGNSMHLGVPLEKVDVQRRLVSGYATLDNEDTQGDVVLAEASRKAFERARGNLREMHQPIAVGKVVDFVEKEYFHNGKFYRGIYVTAHVSEGAEDTWKKVLDGTLTGFSIGGSVNDYSNEYVDELGKTVRFIKDYDLVELSLVDNPANQLANVFSIQKSATGSVTVKGMAAETVVESVFYCENDENVQVCNGDSDTCIRCGSDMENIGWFESGQNREQKVREVVEKFRTPVAETGEEGGVEMSKTSENLVKPEEVVEAPEVETVEVEENKTEEVVEEAVEVDETDESADDATDEAVEVEEVEDEEEVISKKIDELKDTVKDILDKSRTETNEIVSALEKKIDSVSEDVRKKTSELEDKLSEIGENLGTAKARLAELENSLSKVNDATALKKSADAESAETVSNERTLWRGAFSVDEMFR